MQKQHIQKLRELIDNDLPIPVPDLVKAGFASRPTIWRKVRAGMPVIRIGRRMFVRFSDLVGSGSGNP